MFYMIPLVTNFDYILIISICCFCFFVGFLISKYKTSVENKPEPEKDFVTRNNYRVSNFGVPGEIRATKTYDRSGVFVSKLPPEIQNIEMYTSENINNRKDDLKKIEGINAHLEKSFNEYGLYTFKQLIHLNNEDKTTISKISSMLPQQLKLDDIRNQARIFCSREELSA